MCHIFSFQNKNREVAFLPLLASVVPIYAMRDRLMGLVPHCVV